MSTKTIKQRIALVAVSALTAGVLSVMSAPSAFAGTGDITVDADGGTTGICSAKDSAFQDITADLISELATPLTITIARGGTMNIDVDTSTHGTYDSNGVITVTNATSVLHSTYGVYDGLDATYDITASNIGTVTLKMFGGDPYSAANTPATVTQTGSLTIVVVASCAATGYSSAFSGINVKGEYDAGPEITDGDVLSYGAGADAYINIVGRNQYNAVLPVTTTWVASATGANVKIGTDTSIDATTTAAGTLTLASTDAAGTNISIRVTPLSRTAGGTAVVTITAEGVAVGTRTITFLPEADTINVVGIVTGPVGGEGAVIYSLSKGTTSVPGGVSALGTTFTNRVSSLTNIKDASIAASDLSPGGETESSTTVDWATAIGGSANATSVYGLAEYTCATGGGSGSTSVTLEHETPVTEVTISKVVALTCAGGIATYTVSMDKAAYKIGEVGTLTITAKDSSGNPVHDFSTVGTTDITAGGGTLTKAAATSDGFTAGVRKYSVQMTTGGAFNAVVNIAGVVTKSASTGYTVTGGDTSMSEVLKSIVALIASINKQISALQKLILKR
jgi:hypothetical protein